MSTDEELR